MIDLHSHLLAGIDDGAQNADMSIAMAHAFVADGIVAVACTPHILPGLYHNTGPRIREMVAALQSELDARSIQLRLFTGADNHIVPDFVGGLRSGHLLSLADSRYVLVEPPHHVAPQRMEEFFFNIQAAGYVPILTHPERLSWLSSNYDVVRRLVANGVWMQITAASIAGAFGRNPLYWASKMLDEGSVHILASDAHDTTKRPPMMRAGFEAAAKRVGEQEAINLVVTRPRGIIENISPSAMPGLPAARSESEVANVDASGTGRTSGNGRPAAQGSSGHGSGGLAERMRRFFK